MAFRRRGDAVPGNYEEHWNAGPKQIRARPPAAAHVERENGKAGDTAPRVNRVVPHWREYNIGDVTPKSVMNFCATAARC
jgi:hypothetical protein